jgi:predicted nucleotidyltransferase
MATSAPPPVLPPTVTRILDGFVEAARETLGENLRSVVLFGTGAESRLRGTSDVNLIVVLERFEAMTIDRLREPYRLAQAAIPLHALFLLHSEIPAAAEAFAAKLDDVKRRRRVLFGEDPFAELEIPRAALEARLKQALLNTSLRLRSFYVERGLREEQLVRAVADAAAPCDRPRRPCSSSRTGPFRPHAKHWRTWLASSAIPHCATRWPGSPRPGSEGCFRRAWQVPRCCASPSSPAVSALAPRASLLMGLPGATEHTESTERGEREGPDSLGT